MEGLIILAVLVGIVVMLARSRRGGSRGNDYLRQGLPDDLRNKNAGAPDR